SGARYEGEFKKDLKEGKGVFTSADGDVYSGEYKADKRNGYGVYTWKNGETYTGYFLDDYMDTRLRNEDGTFRYDDKNDYVHRGESVYTWPNGHSYTGFFVENKIVGVGFGGN
ncbi:MAG: molecular chaperone Tir, partial [Clostridia bacterium]|nr:molecular chaperone Tir [Clostridia bacterium]